MTTVANKITYSHTVAHNGETWVTANGRRIGRIEGPYDTWCHWFDSDGHWAGSMPTFGRAFAAIVDRWLQQ